MKMVFVLIILSLILVIVAVWALIWSINKGQFDDLDSPALSILDDELESYNKNNTNDNIKL